MTRLWPALMMMPLLAACGDGQPLISTPRIVDQRGGDTLYIDNGVCLLAYSTSDEEHVVLQPPSMCGL